MPELPEVETVRKVLEKEILGKIFGVPEILLPSMIKTGADEFKRALPGKKILSLGRKGKTLIFHLSDDFKILFHLRMEGKLFVVDKKNHDEGHLPLLMPFVDSDKALAFYDTRKFGTCHLLHEEEQGPLASVGKEPFEFSGPEELYRKIHPRRKCIKEILMDQKVIAGIGNIYADEILFASHLSPFKPGNKVSKKECETLLKESQRILSLAIENNGSTIRTYRASETLHGDMQDFLKVYGRKGKICPCCHTFKIEKLMLSGRGTSYCSKCQHTGISIAVTGKIGSGKSLACHYFQQLGYVPFSADKVVHDLYEDKDFLSLLKKKFPEVFTPSLDKKKIGSLLVENKTFKRRYTSFLFAIVRKKAETFLIENDGKDKVLEIPLLFDAHMDKDFTFLLGTETTRQKEHLHERGEKDIKSRMDFNKINAYDKNRHKLDFILTTDYSKKHLKDEVRKVDAAIKELLSKAEEKEHVLP